MPVNAERLRDEVRKVYSEVVRDPKRGYHFHTGPEYAVARLGYSRDALAELPDAVTAPFADVGNPLSLGLPSPSQTIVDIGAGSGLDTFLAAKATGPSGRVIAVDMTDAMLERGGRTLPSPVSPRSSTSRDRVMWRGKPFEGASGQRKADKYEVERLNIQARKVAL